MFNEYNTKITYYENSKLNLKKTARAYAKFYFAYYGRIALKQLKRKYNAIISSQLHQATN